MRDLLYILLFLLLGGCGTDLSDDLSTTAGEGRLVSINLSPVSRSLTSNIADAWEKTVNTGRVYIFNSSGKAVYSYTLTSSDISAVNNVSGGTINFLIPGNLSTCDVYFVVNTVPSATVTSKTALLSSFEQDISLYNGAFASVSTSATRPNGFVMTASQDGVVLNPTQTTNISLALKRIVAKVSIKIQFTTVIGLGAISMNNVVITQSAPYSNLFPLANGKTGGTPVTFTQAGNASSTPKVFEALFYVYENDARALNSNWINIYFSGQGTLLIATNYAYNVKISGELLAGAGTGQIIRNRMYYITINVTKLTTILGRADEPYEVTVAESDW